MTILKKTYYKLGASMTVGALLLSSAKANAASGKTFNDVAQSVAGSVESLPGLITSLSYLFGVLLAVLGIIKIKDHVENPTQTHLKDGAIRLCAGGMLFALPVILQAMLGSIGSSGTAVVPASLKKAQFTVS